VSKDRAAPFSRKHRRYWIPVTGTMIVIGGINLGLGLCSYKPAEEPQRIELGMSRDAGLLDAANTLGSSQLPPDVMRAFAVKYPRILPAGAARIGTTFVISFPPAAPHHHATFAPDGSFVSED
jgi:hypothetical protein